MGKHKNKKRTPIGSLPRILASLAQINPKNLNHKLVPA